MRKREGVSNHCVNGDLKTLKHLFVFAEEPGVISSNPVAKFKRLKEEEKAVPRYTDEEIQSVMDAVRWDCRPLFGFIRETGSRLEEALSLEHWQVQVKQKVVVFGHYTKSGRYRYVPLTKEAIEAVTALPPLEGCPYVFYNRRSKTRWSRCRGPWDEARKAVGVPKLRVKDLRSHFAIKLAESGAQMHDIQQVLGHSSVAVTERHYAQFSPEHSSKKVLRVLEGGK